jgi:DNA-directed RNA polymerase specialized sigma24 family protein
VYYEKGFIKSDPILNEKAYLMGIAKHLWTKRFQEKIRQSVLSDPEEQLAFPEKEELASSEKLLRFLETAGEKCMELLRGFYYEKLSPNEIAGRFGFSGIRSATVQKFKCLEKVRNTVKEKSLSYEDFLD